jgi:hypothetical protein
VIGRASVVIRASLSKRCRDGTMVGPRLAVRSTHSGATGARWVRTCCGALSKPEVRDLFDARALARKAG